MSYGINYGLNIYLEPFRECQLEKMFSYRNHSEIIKYTRQYTTLDWDKHKQYWQKVQTDPNNKMFMIETNNDALIGVCGLTNIDYINRHAEFSLYIGPEFQKKGYGKEALYTLLRHGFDAFNLNKIWGESFDFNPALNMFQTLGMKLTNGHHLHYYRNGCYIDSIFSHITKAQFRENQGIGFYDSLFRKKVDTPSINC